MERITPIVKLSLKSSSCDYSGVEILVNGTIVITGDAGPEPEPPATARTQIQIQKPRQNDERNKGVTFKNYAPFTGASAKYQYQIQNFVMNLSTNDNAKL